MAMLAEPRRKTKWTLNPRGKFWSEDRNKFGQRMLEKMGWCEGKGLGAREQGITSHVSVKVKSDNKGLGSSCKDSEWFRHQEQFEGVLANLNESMGIVGDVEAPTSLEEVSKKIKSRLHYAKFARGKDLSQYSKKDLDCILGVASKKEEPFMDNVEDNIGAVDTVFGVTTIVGGSIEGYLKKKNLPRYTPCISDNSPVKDTRKVKEKLEEMQAEDGVEEIQIAGVESVHLKKKKNKHDVSNSDVGGGRCPNENLEKIKKKRKLGSASMATNEGTKKVLLSEDDNLGYNRVSGNVIHDTVQSIADLKAQSVNKSKKKYLSSEESVKENSLEEIQLVNDQCQYSEQEIVTCCELEICEEKKNDKENVLGVDLTNENNEVKLLENDHLKNMSRELKVKCLDRDGKCKLKRGKKLNLKNDVCISCAKDRTASEILIVKTKSGKKKSKLVSIDVSGEDITYHNAVIENLGCEFNDKSTDLDRKLKDKCRRKVVVNTETSLKKCSAVLTGKDQKKSGIMVFSACGDVKADTNVNSMRNQKDCLVMQSSDDNSEGMILKRNSSLSKVRFDERHLEEITYYSCLKKKEMSDSLVSESLQLFHGANLQDVKGYDGD